MYLQENELHIKKIEIQEDYDYRFSQAASKKAPKVTNHAELKQYMAREAQNEVVKGDKPDGLFLAPIAEVPAIPKKLPLPVKSLAPKNVKSKVNTNAKPALPVKSAAKTNAPKEKSVEYMNEIKRIAEMQNKQEFNDDLYGDEGDY